jgi:hypothetical protein
VTDISATGGLSVTTFQGHEREAREYLYWTPTRSTTMFGQYSFQYFANGRALSGIRPFTKLSTHNGVVGGRWFHPIGFSVGVQLSRIDQTGTFLSSRGQSFTGEDAFWTVDAFARYRLPNRIGQFGVEARNLFDTKFRFQEIDPTVPRVFFSRHIVARLGLFL